MGPQYPQSSFRSSPVLATTYSGDLRFGMVDYDRGSDAGPATLVWSQSTGGNGSLWSVVDSDDSPRLLSATLNVRGEIGYGGGEFTVSQGYVYFVSGGRIYRVGVGDNVCRDSKERIPQSLTPVAFGSWASPVVSPDGRWLVAVHEDELERTRLVVFDTAGRLWPKILVDGFDFLMEPRFDPVDHSLVWVAWREGEMPWDAATLWRAPWIEPDSTCELPQVGSATKIAGGTGSHGKNAVLQPEFLTNGQLVYLSDETGYGRFVTEPRSSSPTNSASGDSTDVYELFQPAWVQETRVYAVLPDATLAVIVDRGGVQSLERFDPITGTQRPIPGIPPEYREFQTLDASPDGRIATIASGPQTPPRLIEWNHGRVRIVRRSSSEPIASADLANCTPVSWASKFTANTINREGGSQEKPAENDPIGNDTEWKKANTTESDSTSQDTTREKNLDSGATKRLYTQGDAAKESLFIHGIVWEPVRGSRNITPPQLGTNNELVKKELPPLLVMVHGGPTAHVRAGWNTTAQYFATRGWLVLSVNHRGSTGYGRRYRDELRGQWGVVDCEDIVSGVQELCRSGRCDPKRVVILGGSAGGFTALTVLQRYPEWFTAGIISYPVADLYPTQPCDDGRPTEPKFERHYFEWLIGPYPECSQIYEDRSPLRNGRKFRVPMAIFHGRNDRIVPISQSESLALKLTQDNTPYVFRAYEEESHGFRRAETLEDYYRTIAEFLATWEISPR